MIEDELSLDMCMPRDSLKMILGNESSVQLPVAEQIEGLWRKWMPSSSKITDVKIEITSCGEPKRNGLRATATATMMQRDVSETLQTIQRLVIENMTVDVHVRSGILRFLTSEYRWLNRTVQDCANVLNQATMIMSGENTSQELPSEIGGMIDDEMNEEDQMVNLTEYSAFEAQIASAIEDISKVSFDLYQFKKNIFKNIFTYSYIIIYIGVYIEIYI